ncbi:Putative transcription elongation factor SPT5 like 1 [Dendrobium catenatum]|uniref:Transcription elongation factor SPT5 like 1 n=1 Tax=Dendrobium catenatum TaxID=906689 RepID=A0A2I0X6I0_9ASPA|nr:Putative transcription elongation factor SPT5 like 1 [Dendrobium catenatum]
MSRQPAGSDCDGHRDANMPNLLTLISNRKKGHFMKGDKVIVGGGDMKNLKGLVEEVEVIIHVKPETETEDLPETLSFNEKDLCKCFKLGDYVKVISGIQEGATGFIVKVDGYMLILISDITNEEIHVFADNVVKNDETIIGGDERHNRGGGSGGRRGNDALVGRAIKIRSGPFKGYHGRVVRVIGSFVRVELDSHMKIVTVKRDDILDAPDSATPFREPSRYGFGSETPMHPSRTPLHPSQTAMRDAGGHDFVDPIKEPTKRKRMNDKEKIGRSDEDG